MDRADVDDRSAATLRVHPFETGACGQEGSVEVDGEHSLPVGEFELINRCDDLDASIGHEDVDSTQTAADFIDAGGDLELIGDVHPDGERRPAAGIEFLC